MGGKDAVNGTLSSDSPALHSAFQTYLSPFWSRSKIWLMKRVLLITACPGEATVTSLTADASNVSLNWVLVFIYLSGNKAEEAPAVTVNELAGICSGFANGVFMKGGEGGGRGACTLLGLGSSWQEAEGKGVRPGPARVQYPSLRMTRGRNRMDAKQLSMLTF